MNNVSAAQSYDYMGLVKTKAAFVMKIMCPSCDTSRAIAHALWRPLSNDFNGTLLTGMLNAARLSCFAHYNI